MRKYISHKLSNANRYAYICSPYIDQYYADAILSLAEKGVLVKVIASDRQAKGFSLVDYFDDNYEGNENNIDCITIDGFVYVVDDSDAVDGSANLTYNGIWNQVNNVHVYDTPAEVQNVKRAFEKIWEYNSGQEEEDDDEEEDHDDDYDDTIW